MTNPEPELAEPQEPTLDVAALDEAAIEVLRTADRHWIGEALAMAEKGLAIGELPIGAVVVVDEEVIGWAFTRSHPGSAPCPRRTAGAGPGRSGDRAPPGPGRALYDS